MLSPLADKFSALRDPLNKGALETFDRRTKGLPLVLAHINDDFIRMCDHQVVLDESSADRAVSRFNKNEINV